MNYPNSWIGRVLALALVVTAGVGLMTALGMADETLTRPATVSCAAGQDLDRRPIRTEAICSANLDQLDQDEDLLDPVAICRLRPECSSNEECDTICGVGLGKCVHSKCPVRICTCR